MSTLSELLLTPDQRPHVVRDAAQLVDSEVGAKSGLTGLAVKGAYKVVTKVKPGLVPEVIDGLIEKFVAKLEPFFAEWVASGKTGTFEAFLLPQKNKVANALLSVTDDRARTVQNATLKKSYEALRPTGEKHVEAAVPGLARVLGQYIKS